MSKSIEISCLGNNSMLFEIPLIKHLWVLKFNRSLWNLNLTFSHFCLPLSFVRNYMCVSIRILWAASQVFYMHWAVEWDDMDRPFLLTLKYSHAGSSAKQWSAGGKAQSVRVINYRIPQGLTITKATSHWPAQCPPGLVNQEVMLRKWKLADLYEFV